MRKGRHHEHRDPARRRALALRAADLFALAAQEAAAARGRFAVALSGGETPRALYRLLARQQFAQKIPWRHVQLYWGDERCVPPDDARSNYGMAREAFIGTCPSRGTCTACAARMSPTRPPRAYESELRDLAAAGAAAQRRARVRPRAAGSGRRRPHRLAVPAQRCAGRGGRWAAPSEAPDGTPRLTVTLPVINAARRVWFLVSGAEKAGMVAEVLEGSARARGRARPGRRAGTTGRADVAAGHAAAAAQLSAAVRG